MQDKNFGAAQIIQNAVGRGHSGSSRLFVTRYREGAGALGYQLIVNGYWVNGYPPSPRLRRDRSVNRYQFIGLCSRRVWPPFWCGERRCFATAGPPLD